MIRLYWKHDINKHKLLSIRGKGFYVLLASAIIMNQVKGDEDLLWDIPFEQVPPHGQHKLLDAIEALDAWDPFSEEIRNKIVNWLAGARNLKDHVLERIKKL
ncbi:MAG: hypothetical protein FWD08_00315 [Alphaproteobacteria bacterium]|nr:hypothetical protein [Alphaproteobacteria bacterium]